MSASDENRPATPPAPSPPACYRHPGRETHIRCTRCSRPICPDCMIDANVGFQCPECVRAGHRQVRQARTVFGGRPTDGTPAVTYTLLVLNVALFLLGRVQPALDQQLEMIGWWPRGNGSAVGVLEGEWWRLVTSAFVHANVIHLALNMWTLWVLGPTLESWLGRSRFLALYLVTAVTGSTAVYWLAPPVQPTVGASTALFGLFGALLLLSHRQRYDVRGLLVWLAILLVFPFLSPGLNVSWQGHLGGLVGGLLLGVALGWSRGRWRTAVQVAALVGVLAGALALVAFRSAHLLDDPAALFPM